MSYVELFYIDETGDVLHFGIAHNNHGFAPLMWTELGIKYGFLKPGDYSVMHPGTEKLWAAFGNEPLSRQDSLLLGTTFDRVWIRKEGLAELTDNMLQFYREVIAPKYNVCTVLTAALMLKKLRAEKPNMLGIAWNMCSAIEPFWYMPRAVPKSQLSSKEAEACWCKGVDLCYCAQEKRPYNVLKDGAQPWGEYKGKKPFELLEALELCEKGEPAP